MTNEEEGEEVFKALIIMKSKDNALSYTMKTGRPQAQGSLFTYVATLP